jgi:hypothetical protein
LPLLRQSGRYSNQDRRRKYESSRIDLLLARANSESVSKRKG